MLLIPRMEKAVLRGDGELSLLSRGGKPETWLAGLGLPP